MLSLFAFTMIDVNSKLIKLNIAVTILITVLLSSTLDTIPVSVFGVGLGFGIAVGDGDGKLLSVLSCVSAGISSFCGSMPLATPQPDIITTVNITAIIFFIAIAVLAVYQIFVLSYSFSVINLHSSSCLSQPRDCVFLFAHLIVQGGHVPSLPLHLIPGH